MKKKYIIALEDRNVWSCGLPAKTLLLSDVSIFGTDLASVNTGIELTPYTEPDLDAIRKEAYSKGFDDGRNECASREICMNQSYQHGYETGLDDAWDAARTLWNTPNRKEIFGHTTFNTVLTTLTAQETIEKIRQYEQEKRFHVGDEIETQNGFKGFVIREDDKYVYFVDEKGEGCVETMMAAKTGRHFPEIAEVLRKMKEG